MVGPLLCSVQERSMAMIMMESLVDLTACLKTIVMREMRSCRICKNQQLSKKYPKLMHLAPVSQNLNQTILLAHLVMMMISAPPTKRRVDIRVPPKSKSQLSLKRTMTQRRKSLFHRLNLKHQSPQRKCSLIAMKTMMHH